MALEEGFRHLRFVGKGILLTGLILEAAALVYALAGGIIGRGEFAAGFGFFGAIGIPICVLGAAILLVAWIAEGFLLPRRPPRP